MDTVGELLRHWRHRRGLSQLDLAIAADVSARHVSLVETGKSTPSVDRNEELVLSVSSMAPRSPDPPNFTDSPPYDRKARVKFELRSGKPKRSEPPRRVLRPRSPM